MRIAIIDDDDVFQFLCARLIVKISPDHQIQKFVNGLTAYEYFEAFALHLDKLPQLIILDINMPSMNGWQLLTALKALRVPNYSPCIFIVSSTLDETDINMASQFPELRGFKTKPISQTQLAALIASAQQ